MNKIWNINAILCEKTDSEITDIKNIFDTLRLKKGNTAAFTIITFLNAIRSDEDKFGLYYFIERIPDEKEKNALRTYLGNTIYVKDKDVGKNRLGEKICGSAEHSVSKMVSEKIEGIDFPSAGQYELQVFKYDGDSVVDLENKSVEECEEWVDEEKLVSTYPFKVKFLNE